MVSAFECFDCTPDIPNQTLCKRHIRGGSFVFQLFTAPYTKKYSFFSFLLSVKCHFEVSSSYFLFQIGIAVLSAVADLFFFYFVSALFEISKTIARAGARYD